MQVFNINDSYFKYLKCLSGITYQYVNQLDDIYEKNLMVGTNYSIYCMYNEFDIINNFMVNLYQVDACSTDNIDISQRFYKIDGVILKSGHRVLLADQTNTIENNVYNVDSRGYLSVADDLKSTGTTWRYKAYVKMGDTNKYKQFHLKNVGNRFPLYNEKKEFVEAHGYIIKNYFNYDMFNIGEDEDIIPKLIFADYEMARISVNRDIIVNDNIYPKNLWEGFDVPTIFDGGSISIKYHDTINYVINIIDSGSTVDYTYSDNVSGTTTMNILNVDTNAFDEVVHRGSETWVLISDDAAVNTSINDYIKLEISGTTNLYLKTFVKRFPDEIDEINRLNIPIISGCTWIVISDYIDDNIVNDLNGFDSYNFTNLMYAIEGDNTSIKTALEECFLCYYYKVEELNDVLRINPEEYKYNKYFDYDGLEFTFGLNSGNISGVVYGRKYDANTGTIYIASLPQAEISYTGTMTGYVTADNNGIYSLDLKAGTYDITYSKDAYIQTTNSGVVVNIDDTITSTVYLDHYLGNITGTCTDHYNGLPIEDCVLTVIPFDVTGQTDVNGEYFVNDIISGDASITCTNSNYGSLTLYPVVPESDTIEVDFDLWPNYDYMVWWLSGITTDINNDPLSGVSVISTTTDINGEYGPSQMIYNPLNPTITIIFSKYGYSQVETGLTYSYRTLHAVNAQLDYQKMNINGYVNDIDFPAEYINGATLILSGTSFNSLTITATTTTNSSGYYEFNSVALFGDYNIKYSATNYYSGITTNIIIDESYINPFDFSIEHHKGSLSGITTELDSGSFIEDALVDVIDDGLTDLTDEFGEYLINDIRTGSKTVHCTKENHTSGSTIITILEGTTVSANFILDLKVDLSGKTTDLDTGNPIDSVNLTLSTIPPDSYITGTNGKFLFEDIQSGTYDLEYTKTGYYSGETNGIVVTNSNIYSAITMEHEKGIISAEVLYSITHETPISGATITALTTPQVSGETDSMGQVTLNNVRSVSMTIKCEYPDFPSKTSTVTVSASPTVTNVSFIYDEIYKMAFAGWTNGLILDYFGNTSTFGNNLYGQLGNNSTSCCSLPVAVYGNPIYNIVDIGHYHMSTIKSDGKAWSWGYNLYGQVGDGSTTNRSTPVSVYGNHTFCEISAGQYHTLAIDKNNNSWAWGLNGLGRLGDNSITLKSTPVLIYGNHTFCKISAGVTHSVGLDNIGVIWTWGSNQNGQLGTGDLNCHSTPIVLYGTKTFCKISAGNDFTTAIDKNGIVFCWGSNDNGQLGINSKTEVHTPISICGASSHTFCEISSGYEYTMALDVNGGAWGWGYGGSGQLGDGGYVSRLTPVSTLGSHTFCRISSGQAFTLALDNNNVLWIWGERYIGNVASDISSPIQF